MANVVKNELIGCLKECPKLDYLDITLDNLYSGDELQTIIATIDCSIKDVCKYAKEKKNES